MTNLNEKFTQWVLKVKEGKKNYMMITRCEDSWFLLGQKHAEPIVSLKVAIDRGYGLTPDYEYDITNPDTDGLCMTAVIKDENKLIVHDCNGDYAFGIKGVESPTKAFFIYARTEDMHSFIFAYKKCGSVNVVHELAFEECDAITCFMDDILKFDQQVETDIKEGNEDGREMD